ncbi:MAG: hypothetical protein JRH20_14650 [Deltaproteobacteria bacterium]|nr:hypothetical protein [Deltaproteobacteria bacterium]
MVRHLGLLCTLLGMVLGSVSCVTRVGFNAWDAATSDAATSDAATSDAATSDAATSDAATSDAVTSDAVTSDAVTSDAVTSDAATSDAATSDAATLDAATSDAATPDTVASVCQTQTEIPVAECQILVTLYNETNGNSWTDASGWLATATPCSWNGVTCDAGHVSHIGLNYNVLTGNIPPELGNLVHLTHLSLTGNQLTGPIPPELGNLMNLTSLRLYINELSGSIPPEIGHLSKLIDLHLYSNTALGGTLPAEMGNLNDLETFIVVGNNVTGVEPGALTGVMLRHINLRDNALDVDEALRQIYATRANYTYPTPNIYLDQNASPSGTSTDPAVIPGVGGSNADWSWNGNCHDPLTGKAMAFALQNDACAEGFNPWSISIEP